MLHKDVIGTNPEQGSVLLWLLFCSGQVVVLI